MDINEKRGVMDDMPGIYSGTQPHVYGPHEMKWFALYVKSRYEYITNVELRKKRIETFLPTVLRLRQWKDRKKEVEFPLFPGYIFVHIPANPEEYLKVLKTRGAVSFVALVSGVPSAVSYEELQSLRILLESGDQFDIYPSLVRGKTVQVRRGPLRGAQGIIGKKEDEYMFIVNIDLLGRSVSVKVCGDDLDEI